MPAASPAITVTGFCPGASVAAQILLGLRRVENWILWVLIDIAAITLYIDRGLYPTAGLYGGMLVMSLFGLREWVLAARRAPEAKPLPA